MFVQERDAMFNVSIVNNYRLSIFLNGGNQVIANGGGGTGQVNNWGSNYLTVPGMGDINFIDMADTKLNQYTSPKIPWTNSTWGGLVRYRSEDAYFRYEGQGQINLVVDQFGSVQLSFPQGGMIVSLNELTIN
jgi:hypothetical protein